jgi:hypothetical protein
MKTLFEQFVAENKDKTFNEILGLARANLNNTWLLCDVDDYNNNEIKCTIGYHSNNNPNNHFIHIEVEYLGGVFFKLLYDKVKMLGREWEFCSEFTPKEGIDWEVIQFDEWTLWMNNLDGEMHLVSKTDGTILGCIF